MPIATTEAMIETARAAVPELPAARAERYEHLGVSPDRARLLAFRGELGEFFERALAAGDVPADAAALANWIGDALAEIVARVVAADPDAAQKVRDGNEKAIGALVGPVMRETRGRADGAEVTRLIREALGVG